MPKVNKDNIDKEITLYLYRLTKSSDIFNHALEKFDLIKETDNIIKELIEKVISHLVVFDTRKISKDRGFYIRNLGENVEGLAFIIMFI